MTRLLAVLLLLLALSVAQPAWAQFDKVLKGLGGITGGGGLNDAKIGSGLQEALEGGHGKRSGSDRDAGWFSP